MKLGMPWHWVTFPQYLDSLDRAHKAIDIVPYVPAGPMLVEVLGLDDAKAGRMPTSAHKFPGRRSLPHRDVDRAGAKQSVDL